MADIKISEMLGASLPLSGNEIVPILQFDENRTIQTKNLRALLSASGDINFDDSTGVISFTERTDSEVRGLVSATGDLSYDSGTGEFSVTTYKSGDFDTDFGNKSTDNLSEGATNLYYTDLRSRSSLSATGDLSYDSATGTISFTERTDQEVRDLFSATGDLSYDSATGTISFTERTDAQVRELLSASGDLSYDSGTGEFSVTTYSDADVQTKLGSVSGNIVPDTTEVYDLGTSTLRFRDLYLSGTTVDLAGTKISSNENGDIEIRDAQNNPSKITAAGIDIGTGADRITISRDPITGGLAVADAATGASASVEADISANTTDDLTEGTSNLYYTDTRVRGAVSAGGDLSYDSGTGEFLFTERTDQEVRGLVSATGDLSYDSGTGEFSFTERTDQEVRDLISASGDLLYTSSTGEFSITTYKSADFDTDFGSKSTDDLSEGTTNLYYTDSRVDSHLTGGNGVTYSTGEISIGQSVATSDSVTFAGVGVSGLTSLQQTTEVLNTKFAPSGVVDHDFSTGAIWYHLNVSSDFTANFTNVPTTDNRATNVVLVLNNSPGVGIPNAVQIDGVSQTINWADATVPEGTAEQTDIVSFTLIRQNSSWLVTGSLNTFG